jgi:hypothetical protein
MFTTRQEETGIFFYKYWIGLKRPIHGLPSAVYIRIAFTAFSCSNMYRIIAWKYINKSRLFEVCECFYT